MFRRVKREQTNANRLSDEAEPNSLTWEAGEVNEAADDDAGEDEYEDDDLEGEDELDAEDEVDPAEQARRAAELQAELARQAEEFGLTGTAPVAIFGPNGEAVASLLDALTEIDDKTAEAIADAYDAIPEAEHKVAQSVVSRRHRGGDLGLELQAAERAVGDWLGSLRLAGGDADLYAIVADAATDAVDALVLEDRLADVDFATLYGPWSEVMDSREEGEGEDGEEGEAEDEDEEEEEAGEFGPNTEVVLEFLTKLAEMDAAQTAKLVEVWRRQPKEELRIAHRNLQALADEEHRWREQLRLAQEEVFAWMAGRGADTKRDYSFGATGTVAAIREPAGPVVADAIAALVMADVLEPEDAKVLYAPWAEVIKEPALPEFEDDEEPK